MRLVIVISIYSHCIQTPASPTAPVLPLPPPNPDPVPDAVISTPGLAQTPASSYPRPPIDTQPRSSASTRRVNPFASPTVFPTSTSAAQASFSSATASAKRVGALDQYLSPLKKAPLKKDFTPTPLRNVTSTPLRDVTSTPFDEDREVSAALPASATPKVILSGLPVPPSSVTVVSEEGPVVPAFPLATNEAAKSAGPSFDDDESDVFGPTRTNERGSSPSIQVLSRLPSSATSLSESPRPATLRGVAQEQITMGASFSSSHEDSPGSSSEVQELLEEDWPMDAAPEQSAFGVAESAADIIARVVGRFWMRDDEENSEVEDSILTSTAGEETFDPTTVSNDDVDMLEDNGTAHIE